MPYTVELALVFMGIQGPLTRKPLIRHEGQSQSQAFMSPSLAATFRSLQRVTLWQVVHLRN